MSVHLQPVCLLLTQYNLFYKTVCVPETFSQMSNEVFTPHYLWNVVVDTIGLLSRLPSTVSNSCLASYCRWAVGCPVCHQSEKWGEQSNNRSSQLLLTVSPLVNCLLPNQLSSVTRSCPTLCDPMNHTTPGLPVHHQLPEFTQTHVQCVGDAIQPSHPLSSPSRPALNLFQHQSLC